MPTSLIIGAGMAGLIAARELTQHGWTVTILDKGRGVGGRMATRRLEQARADHGAQYFSAKTSEFQEHVQQWVSDGVVKEWALREANGGAQLHHPRYVGTDGMSAITKHLARTLNVRTNERVVKIEVAEAGWRALTESGNDYAADSLIVTIPAPQALALIQDSSLTLAADEVAALSSIVYQPCLAVIVALNQPSRMPAPGEIRYEHGPVAWVADNYQKGISPDQPSVTIHAGHAFSQAHLEDDLNAVGDQLIGLLGEHIPAESVVAYQVHRWRYSLAEQRYPDAFLAVKTPFPLVFGGDGFGVGNVEGAFLSGLRMARYLNK